MRTALLFIFLVAVPAAAQTYAVYGAERYFTLGWQAGERHGRPVVAGYVANEGGLPVRDVRLRVEQLDAAGGVTATSVGYVAGILTPGTRAYFEVPVAGPSPTYRVTILSFDFIQALGP